MVKNLLREWKCDVVCLQEMKIFPYVDWAVLEANQTTCGILLMWDKRVLVKMEVLVGTFSMSVKWQGVGGQFYMGLFRHLWPQ